VKLRVDETMMSDLRAMNLVLRWFRKPSCPIFITVSNGCYISTKVSSSFGSN